MILQSSGASFLLCMPARSANCPSSWFVVFVLQPTPKAVYNFKVYLIALMGTAAALDYGYDLGFIGTTQSLEPYKEMMGTAHNAAYRTSFNSNVVAIVGVRVLFHLLSSPSDVASLFPYPSVPSWSYRRQHDASPVCQPIWQEAHQHLHGHALHPRISHPVHRWRGR